MILKKKIKYLDDFLLRIKSKKIIFKDINRSFTLNEIVQKFNFIVHFLIKKNFKNNDRVLIISDNQIEILLIQFAASYLGGVSSIIDKNLKVSNISYIVDDFSPKYIFVNHLSDYNSYLRKKNICLISINEIKNKKRKKRPVKKFKKRVKDLAIVIYTSGTTGEPKGIMCSHDNIVFSTFSIQNSLQYNNENIAVFLPLSFDYGLYQIYLGLISNSSFYIGNTDQIATKYLNIIKKKSITALPLVSTHLQILLHQLKKSDDQKTSLRLITNTGSSLRYDLVKKLKSLIKNLKVFSMYGLTECKRISILDSGEYFKNPKSVGKPIKGTKCWVVNSKGKKISKDLTKGELVVQGRNVTLGYLNDPILTKKIFRRNHYKKTNLHTGDICSIDKRGFIYFFGRKDDIFKYKDYRLSKKDIENTVNKIVGIDDTFVYVDSNFNNYSIIIQSKLKLETAIEKIKNMLESFKFTEKIYKVKKILRNDRGKISNNFINKISKYLNHKND